MSKQHWNFLAGLCGFTALALASLASNAQEVKEKPPLYGYVADWQVPRASWGEFEKTYAADKAILDKALADGTIVGYGNDEAVVHTVDGPTHDNWWSAKSMAGLIKVLEQLGASGASTASPLSAATKHWDSIVVSTYYNWHPGAYKGGYTRVADYKIKADAPPDTFDDLNKHLIVPLLEKLLADGTIVEYEIDQLAVHTEAPGTFSVVYICPTAEGLDKVNAALQAAMNSDPMGGYAFNAVIDISAHRDELIRGDGVFK